MNPVFEFRPDTVKFIRKQYNLDTQESLDGAITHLNDWLDKQAHFVRKIYSKEYLERILIHSKGSLERAKMKLEKTASYRTLLPKFFEPIPDLVNAPFLDYLIIGFVPKLTNEHYRIFMAKVVSKHFENGYFEYYRFLVMLCEYILAHDYCNGVIAVLDYSEANLYDILKCTNVMEMHQTLKIIMDGFGMRLKGIHMITSSKAIDALISLFKQVVSAKVAERIQVHSTNDSLYKYVSKELLPREYGGQEKSLLELCSNLRSTLESEKNMEYFKEMQQACTNEDYRSEDKLNNEYLGMPGSFRKLNVD